MLSRFVAVHYRVTGGETERQAEFLAHKHKIAHKNIQCGLAGDSFVTFFSCNSEINEISNILSIKNKVYLPKNVKFQESSPEKDCNELIKNPINANSIT